MKLQTKFRNKRPNLKPYIIAIITALAVLLIGGIVIIRKSYSDNLRPVNDQQKSHIITVEAGSSPALIADTLLAKGTIRSDWAFEWYIRNNQLGDKLKAGTYVVYESQSVKEIVDTIVAGKVTSDLVTILPGKRLAEIKDALVQAGFAADAVEAALEPSLYNGHPALTDKPDNASLEGYLYPESFQKVAETTPQEIVRQSLDAMQQRLTPEMRETFSQQGLTVHQAVILASIIELEVSNATDRAQAAQVFLKRYENDISLGSDPTAFYGAIRDGQEPSVLYDSDYNTRIRKGLPPGPIGNITQSSLEAVANPAETDWLFFVAGDDGKTYFSKTVEEHEELTRRYCTKLCNQ